MHKALLREVVRVCQQRQAEGDCPTVDPFSVETLEDAVLQLEKWNKELGEMLMATNPKKAEAASEKENERG